MIVGGIVILALIIYFIVAAFCGWKLQCGGSDESKKRFLADIAAYTMKNLYEKSLNLK